MTRRDTRKYALGVLRARENLRRAKKDATERLAQKFALRYSRAVIDPNYFSTITITP